uniref:Fucosyltransferase n=1 Tax=Parastrongyloides trichosuri TaxID=131310 RepID=A0A0N4Z8E2_PARTI
MRYFITSILLVISYIYFFVTLIRYEILNENKNLAPSKLQRKKILLYTKIFGKTSKWMERSCEELNCELTKDKSLFSTSDAVVFHHADLYSIKDYPKRFFESQKFIFYTLESPYATRAFGPENYFNWIMSYNYKSDITFTYGSKWRKCKGLCNRVPYDSSKILSTKRNRGIVGYISNCYSNSRREKIVEKLRKYIPTTIFGKCSVDRAKQKNGCKQSDYKCEEEVINSYYFYFAFENAICNNYVTEKYWSRYSFNSVPIVMKRYIYEDLNIPSSSFIAVDDFKSAKEMGDYLNYLMNNKNEYLKYFEYRNESVEVIGSDEYHFMNGFCNICKKLRENDKDNKVINNILDTLFKINKCISRKDMHNFANSW